MLSLMPRIQTKLDSDMDLVHHAYIWYLYSDTLACHIMFTQTQPRAPAYTWLICTHDTIDYIETHVIHALSQLHSFIFYL